MANFDVVMPTELISNLQELEKNIVKVENKMLNAATDVLMPEVKRGLKTSIKDKEEPSVLVNSVSKKIRKTKNGRMAVVYFKGEVVRINKKDGVSHTVRNGLKAAVLEYGKKGQDPKPFLRPAMIAKETAMSATMEQVFDKETNKYK